MSDSQRHFVGIALVALAIGLVPLVGKGEELPWRDSDSPDGNEAEIDPVLIVKVSEQMLTDLLREPIREDSHVETSIFGTPVDGEALTYGRLYLDCVQCDDKARFWLLFAGHTWADTVGHSYPAHIHSSTATQFVTGKEFTYAINDELEFKPARIISDMQRQVRGIRSSLPGLRGMIVRNVASRRYASMSQAIDVEAHRQTETRVKESFERQMQSRLGSFRQRMTQLSERVSDMNRDRKYAWNIGTTDGHLLVVASERPTDGSAPPSSLAGISLPELPRDGAALEIWQHNRWREADALAIHESFATFRNLLETLAQVNLIPVQLRSQVDQLLELETSVAAQDQWKVVQVFAAE